MYKIILFIIEFIFIIKNDYFFNILKKCLNNNIKPYLNAFLLAFLMLLIFFYSFAKTHRIRKEKKKQVLNLGYLMKLKEFQNISKQTKEVYLILYFFLSIKKDKCSKNWLKVFILVLRFILTYFIQFIITFLI